MKIFVLCAALLIPTQASTGDYSRIVHQEVVVENRGGQAHATPRSKLSQRIERFMRFHNAPADIAPELAELLSVCEHPRVLAAIPVREGTKYNVDALGAVGEIGAFQVRPEIWGHPGNNVHSQTKKTEQILHDLVTESKGSLSQAVRKYNGSGEKARSYSRDVLKLAASI